MLNEQNLFNVGIGLIATLGGWFMRVIWQSVKDLQLANKELTEKLADMEVLVAGEYAKRAEVQQIGASISAQLNRIEDKLDRKADKP